MSCETITNWTELAEFFSNLTEIETLYFQNSGLEDIPVVVCELHHVSALHFDSNSMQSLSTDTRITCAYKIKKLSLRNNNISFISQDYLTTFTSLEYLGLSRNALRWINPALFQSYLPRLTHVDLSFNNLTTLDMWIFRLTSVKLYYEVFVNMSHNEINQLVNTVGFSIEEISNRNSLYLDIRYNQMTSLSSIPRELNVNKLYNFTRLLSSRFYMKHNPYHCDCDFLEFVQLVTPFKPFYIDFGQFPLELIKVQCVSPKNLEGKFIMDLSFDQFQCNIKQCDLSRKCDCITTPHNSTLRANCADKNMEKFPEFNETYAWTNYELYLANNSISEITSESILLNTTILDLTANGLTIWNKDSLPYFEKLEILLLQRNKLKGLPEGIDVWNVPLKDVRFGHNPFACNCSNKWFKSWISGEKHPISDLNMIVCDSPNWNKGILLTKVPYSDFVCDKLNVLALGLSLSLLTLLIIFIIVISYIKRKYIYLFLFTRFGWRLGCSKKPVYTANKHYDVFIYYSDEDHEKATQISDMLEWREKPFRVCLPYRDFIPGREIAVNILESIQSSKCTTLLVSNHYLVCRWCQYTFKQAHYEAIKEQNCEIILVLLEEIDQSIIEPDMKVYIKTGTYLKTSDHHFFSKLLKDLPEACGERNTIGV